MTENKGDLISREALKEVIKANHYLLSAKNNSTDYGMFTTGIIQAIDNAPAVSDRYDEGFRDGYHKCFNDIEERKENSRLFRKGGAE